MFFGRKRFNFVFVGAGSSVFTMRLVGDILGEDFIEGGEIRLVDIDEKVLAPVAKAVSKLVAHTGKAFEVSAHTHYGTALKEADFVVFTYAVGGYAAWKRDIKTCTRFGVNQSVGDTIGPGAVVRILRSIPLAVEIAKAMEKACPHAYIINYTNPEGAQCLAIQKYTNIKSFGLCHGTPDTAAELAEKVFGVKPEKLAYRAAGVNHLTWFTDLNIDGKDVYPQLEEKLLSSGFAKKEPVSFQLMKVFGLYSAPGDRHVEEFFSTFLRDKVMDRMNLAWKNNDFVQVDSWRARDAELMKEILEKDSGHAHFLEGSGETATHFIRSLATGEVTSEMVNVINQGYISNIRDGIVVEVPTFVDRFGLHPQHIGELPAGIAAKCESLGREYLLLVDAALTGDRQKALQAMYLDPLCAMCDDPEGLLDALIQENLDLLPEYWQK
ncbi:MAG: alpha-glucosidase/alpha-galactosidase [Clostridiales bacterium]|jgi:alpha-galactosidase|nr:alpha-glucosidase/alpha-galactosidase [Clostridiales bacterium]